MWRTALLAALIAASACSTGSGGRGGEGADLPSSCGPEVSFEPGAVPFGELVDSGAFVEAIEPLWDTAWGRVAAWVPQPSDTARISFRVYSTADESIREWLAGALRDHWNPRPIPDGGFSLILSSTGRLEPRTLRALQTCAPTMLNRAEFARRLDGLSGPFERELRVAPLETGLTVYVDESGRVTGSRVPRPSRSARFDETVQGLALDLRFRPAQVEGTPVGVWLALPVIRLAFGDPEP